MTDENVTVSAQPVEKGGLSILVLILGIIGLLAAILLTLSKFPDIVAACGGWIPTAETNPVFSWIILAITFIFLIVSCLMNDRLKKRHQGYPSLIKATSIIYIIGLLVLIVGIVFGFIF